VLVVDVVAIVSTSVPEPPATVDEASEQIGETDSFVAVFATAQLSPTVDVNEFTGVTVIVAVLPELAPASKLIGPLLLSVKLGTASTVTFTVVDPVTLPVNASLPVTVTTYDPGVVLPVVETVSIPVSAPVPVISTDVVTPHVAGLVGLDGVVVTAQVKFTLPVNPFDGVTVMVAVSPVVAPAIKLSAPLFVSAIPGTGGAVTVMLTGVDPVTFPVAESLPLTVTT
jgi:hypothetical protein